LLPQFIAAVAETAGQLSLYVEEEVRIR